MKRQIFALTLLFPSLILTCSAHADNGIKKNPDSIEILYDAPTKAFTKLGPLWDSAGSIDKAMKNLKKQAAKMGADAIIDVKIDTKQVGGSSWVYGIEYPQPVVQGWAIKWN